MSPIKGGASDGGYFIYEASGGPLLVLSMPGCNVVNKAYELTPGNFFYRTEYWDKNITTPSKPSSELKEHYKIIQKVLKDLLIRKNSRWIGLNAWEFLENGEALILDKGKWWNGENKFIRSNLK